MNHFPDPAQVRDQELAEQYIATIPVDTSPPVSPVCGMCRHHHVRAAFRSRLTGRMVSGFEFCRLRAQADLPCTFSSSSTYAQKCSFYDKEVPF